MKCENCNKEHNGNFGSGRFCSEKCKNSFSGKKSGGSRPNRGHYQLKEKIGKNPRWTCKICQEIFRVRKELLDHKREKGHQLNHDLKIILQPGIYVCKFCGRKEQTTKGGNTYHEKECFKNPNRRISAWKGKKHKEESKEKTRISTIKYLESINCAGARFNPNACKFIDNLNKFKNWNLQHALNGGEKIIGGYYLDGFDEEKNIVFEYDESKHYIDLNNNKLSEKDELRQTNIIKKLNCEFWRYNEETQNLYKVH